MTRIVMGVDDSPEQDHHDFPIVEVKEGETNEEAIARAKSYYSPDLECYILERD